MSNFLSPIRLLLLFVVLAILGIASFFYLQVDLLPPNHLPSLSVQFLGGGRTSPELNEGRYTSQFENALSQLTQIKGLQSKSTESGGEINITFAEGVNLDQKRFEIAMILRSLFPRLPGGISYPVIGLASDQSKMEKEAVKVFMVTAPAVSDINDQAKPLIIKAFYRIPGIREVEFTGTPLMEASLVYDPFRCKAFGINPEQIRYAVSNELHRSDLGIVKDGDGKQFLLEQQRSAIDTLRIGEVILRPSTQRPVLVRDVARTILHEQQIKPYYRIDGEQGVNVAIYTKPGINVMQLAAAIDRTAEQINQQLPKGFQLKPVYDKTTYLKSELSKNYTRTLLSIAILTIFILIAYRSWQATVILISGLVMNLLTSMLLAALLKVNVNLYTIGGVTLAFGMMVDNAIVMLDYYRKEHDRKILPAMIGATLTIIAAVSTIFLLPIEQSNNFRDFAAIIIISLICSIIVALGFTPALAELVLGSLKEEVVRKFSDRRRACNNFIRYQRFISLFSRYRYLTVLIFLFLFSEGIYLFRKGLNERAGIRNPEQVKLYLTCNMRDGHTAEQMNTIFLDIEGWLGKQKGIGKFITYIESGQYGGIEIFIKKDYALGRYPFDIRNQLIEKCDAMQGVKWHVFGLGDTYNSFSTDEWNNYSILLKGYNFHQLTLVAEQVSGKLKKNKRVRNINPNERYNWRDRIMQSNNYRSDPERMGSLGLNNAMFYATSQLFSHQNEPLAEVLINNQYFPLFIREEGSAELSRYDFLHELHSNGVSQNFQMGQLGILESSPGSNALYKSERQYLRVLSFDYQGEVGFAQKYQRQIIDEINMELPNGYSASVYQMNQEEGKSFAYAWLLLLLIAVTFIISSMLFENLNQAFLIICLIPLSFVGLFYTFSLGQFSIDQGGYAAFIMLGGLVVNAAIFLINDFNKLRKRRHIKTNRAIAKAFFARSRPIVLTILSCCCGMLPFIFDGKDEVFWYCFALGTVSGLIFSVIPLFIFLPVMMVKKDHLKINFYHGLP